MLKTHLWLAINLSRINQKFTDNFFFSNDHFQGIVEAVEFELSRGFKPKRTILLAFGHDEEVMGLDGAVAINKHLMAKGVQLEFLLDEGTFILKNAIAGVPKEKVAM